MSDDLKRGHPLMPPYLCEMVGLCIIACIAACRRYAIHFRIGWLTNSREIHVILCINVLMFSWVYTIPPVSGNTNNVSTLRLIAT